jgi:hypothetical protein
MENTANRLIVRRLRHIENFEFHKALEELKHVCAAVWN